MTLAAQKPGRLAAQAKPICTSPEDSTRGWSLGWLGLGPGARAPEAADHSEADSEPKADPQLGPGWLS